MKIPFNSREFTELFKIKYSAFFSIHHLQVVSNNNDLILIRLPNRNIYIFDITGKLKLDISLIRPDLFQDNTPIKVGFIKNKNLFFVNNLLIDEKFNLNELIIPNKTPSQSFGLSPRSKSIPIQYNVNKEKFYLHYDNDCDSEIVVFDKFYNLENRIEIFSYIHKMRKNRHSQYLLYLDAENYRYATVSSDCKIRTFNLDGIEISAIENSVINTGSNLSSNKAQYAIFYFQGSKSFLLDLKTGTSKVLWAHQSFNKNYYERFYSNQIKDFSINRVFYAPNDEYLIAGAMQGKYIGCRLPNAERVELIPNNENLAYFENSYFDTLEDQTFFINSDDYMLDRVNFFENGRFFSTHIHIGINNEKTEHILFWNSQFEMVGSWLNSDKVEFINDNLFLSYKDENIIFYQNTNK